jgi:hypothetical protein
MILRKFLRSSFTLCSTWQTFTVKACKKVGISVCGSITAESDGAEIEGIEELMTGDKLFLHPSSASAHELQASTGSQGGAAATKTDFADVQPAGAAIPEIGTLNSPLEVEVDALVLKLRKRNAAADVHACLSLIVKLAANASRPEPKFRSIRLTIPKIASVVSRHPAALQLLH